MEKMRENAPILRFVNQPSLAFKGGIDVTKDSKFEEVIEFENEQANPNDDKEIVYKIKKTVKQTLDNLILTVETKEEMLTPHFDGNSLRISGKDKQVIELYEGCRLVYEENTGYVVPNTRLAKLEAAIESLQKLEKVTTLKEN